MEIKEMTIQERIDQAAGEIGFGINEKKDFDQHEILQRYFGDIKIKTKFKVHMNNAHLRICKKIFKFCIDNKTNKFEIKDLDFQMGLSKTDYGNLNTLCRFGLLYRETTDDDKKVKGGHYGVPLKRLHDFLTCKYAVAKYYKRDPNTKTNEMSDERIYANQIPKYPTIIDQGTFLPLFVEYEILPSNYKQG